MKNLLYGAGICCCALALFNLSRHNISGAVAVLTVGVICFAISDAVQEEK